MTDHITHVEMDNARRFYFWCEADDCYVCCTGRRYDTEAECHDAAAEHERHPG